MKPQKRSSKCETVNLGVSFNLLDPHQANLYRYAKEQFVNFSAAAKRWLETEMKGSNMSTENLVTFPVVPVAMGIAQNTPNESPTEPEFEPRTAFF